MYQVGGKSYEVINDRPGEPIIVTRDYPLSLQSSGTRRLSLGVTYKTHQQVESFVDNWARGKSYNVLSPVRDFEAVNCQDFCYSFASFLGVYDRKKMWRRESPKLVRGVAYSLVFGFFPIGIPTAVRAEKLLAEKLDYLLYTSVRIAS